LYFKTQDFKTQDFKTQDFKTQQSHRHVRGGAMSVVDRVRNLVAPILAEDGLELFDVEFGGGRVTVLVDRPGGVDLDALTRATQRISAEFDRVDPVPGGRYFLEISSPGLERPLRTPAHFQRFVGSLVSVKTVPTAEGERRVKGTLEHADDTGITVDGRRIEYSDIERAQTVFEWGPGPKPGKAGSRAPKKKKHSDTEKVSAP
jgi:ribosome maturation factor RimP